MTKQQYQQVGRDGAASRVVSVPGGRPVPVPVPAQPVRRNLLNQFVGLSVLQCGFESIPLGTPAIPIPVGRSAWYGLARWDAEELGQESAILGYITSLQSPDYEGTGSDAYAPAAPWGRPDGGGAAIVIGLDLPIIAGQWVAGPNDLPLVELGRRWQSQSAYERFCVRFPRPRSLLPVRESLAVQTTPSTIPLTAGRSLGVALVVDRDAYTIPSSALRIHGFVGFADVQIILGLSRTRAYVDV